MATNAEFIVVRNAAFTLRRGRDLDRDFDVTVPDESVGQRSLLSFMLDTAFENTGPYAKLRVRLNDAFYVHTISIDAISNFQQVFDGSFRRRGERVNVLKPGTRANNVEFRIVEGDGGLKIASVVLWVRVPRANG